MKLFNFYKVTNIPKWLFIITFLISTTSAILNLIIPLFIKEAMDSLSNDNLNLSLIFWALFIFILSIITSSVSLYLFKYIGSKSMMDIRSDIWSKTLDLGVEEFDNIETGEIVSRIRNDVEELSQFLTNSVPNTVNYTLVFIGSVTMLFILDLKITLLLIALIPLIGLVIFPIGNVTYNIATSLQNQISDFTSKISNTLNNFKIVKAYTAEEYESKSVDNILQKIFKVEMREAKIQSITAPILSIATMGSLLLIISFSVYRISQGDLTTGTFVALLYYIMLAVPAILSFTSAYTDYKKATGSVEKLSSIIKNKKVNMYESEHLNSNIQSIEFKNVEFKYSDNIILKNVNFSAKKGETIALVGPTGSGKSTIFNLLLKFYSTYLGEILINKKELRLYDDKSIRNKIGYVPQDNNILTGTVLSNIVYGQYSEGKDDLKIQKVNEVSTIDDFIFDNHEKLNFHVGENGSKLSGGQKQRLAVARALYKDSNVLLLDEFSSHLDSNTEFKLTNNLYGFSKNKITFIIAHRLSTIKNADIILFLKDGEITGRGTHDQLYQNHKEYTEYVDKQNILKQKN